jgi:hypothetical protein
MKGKGNQSQGGREVVAAVPFLIQLDVVFVAPPVVYLASGSRLVATWDRLGWQFKRLAHVHVYVREVPNIPSSLKLGLTPSRQS